MLLFPRRKSNQKCAQGARPLENPQFVVYLPSVQAGLILQRVPALRLPPAGPSFGVPPNDWPGDASAACLPTGPNGGPCCGTSVRCRFALQRFGGSPLAAGSVPLGGRQAESDNRQTTRSEPRRIFLFTGHRNSSFAGVSEKTPVYFGGPGGHPRRIFGYFLCAQKVNAGRGAA